MSDLFQLLEKDRAVKALVSRKEGLANLSEVEEALIIATAFRQKKQTMVVVKNNSYTAQQLFNRLYPLLKNEVLLFAMEESLRVEAVAASPDLYANQMNVLASLCLSDDAKLIITHPMGIIRYLPDKEVFKRHILYLKKGDVYDYEKIVKTLQQAGYRQAAHVDQPLTFSQRGGVIDVFSIQEQLPVRIEFFDDEIESIRRFNISTQRTVETIEECTIVPASTLIHDDDLENFKAEVNRQLERSLKTSQNPETLRQTVMMDVDFIEKHLCEHYLYRYQCFFDNVVSLLEYIDNPYVVLASTEEIDNNLEFITKENNDYISELFNDSRGLNYYSLFNDFNRVINRYSTYPIHALASRKETIKSEIKLNYFPLLPLNTVVEEIVRLSKDYHIHLSINSGQVEILENEFQRQKKKLSDYASLMEQELFEGFNYQDEMFLTAKELFGVKMVHTRYQSKFKEATVLESYHDLKVGDYVVHNQYGIGQYEGIVTKEINNHQRDYLQIRYRDNDMVLVPLEQFKLVRKFIAGEGVGVRLSKIGSDSWNKTKAKISKEVSDIAERLVNLYSEREENIGFAFSKDDEYSRQFEANFPYQLTDDQIKAIAEVKADMEKPKPMDRLLCGDVGFGKTEVAMVAAFKACKDLKQVAYLCPTTILARQHYNTFLERFKGFPIRVALLNRYVSEANQRQIIKDLKEGKIDILIGTHRILSKDVEFADLGLLIIDEEQRFGVEAKNKIKEYKKSIDVLSLSATPIPRTLQMSLVGVMSLSQLETPPQNRLPVQTYVVEQNDILIKEAIQRELARGGQVFYLHNNISDIYEVARKISAMVPQARIGIGHGRMGSEAIEDVMYHFDEGDYNILICTTIIETGIDIANCNTILIENADRFGLAQLYQIRGRVGRSDRVAYAYLMYRADRQLSEVANKRLQAIKDFTELGSGYKVAMRDLTIRGAGDLLGDRQAGFINTIGMDLYLEMLNKAIMEKKGLKEEEVEEDQIRVNDIDGYIPGEFVKEDGEKIEIYKKLLAINSMGKLEEYQKEITDIYGKLPASINGLFEKRRVELMLNNNKIERYDQTEKENRIVLNEKTSSQVNGVQLFENVNKISTEIRLKYIQNRIIFTIPKRKNYMNKVIKVLEVIDQL